MTKRNTIKILESLQARGFDTSYIREQGTSVMVDCSQCSALVINGHACHETGCYNTQRKQKGNDND